MQGKGEFKMHEEKRKGLALGVMCALLMAGLLVPAVSLAGAFLRTNQAHEPGPAASLESVAAESSIAVRPSSPDLSGWPSPLVIPAAALNDDGSTDEFFYDFGGGFVMSTGNGSICMTAPAYLPHGAEIKSFRAHLFDNTTDDISISLRRKQNSTTAGSQVMANVVTVGASGAVQSPTDDTVNNNVVDNRNYSYFLTTCMSSTSDQHRIYAAEIHYLLPDLFIPLVMRNYCGGFPGPHEVEPNDDAGQANGPLCFGRAYTGDPDEHGAAQDSDYFYVEVGSNGTLSAQVTNFLPDHAQLQLRDSALNLLDIDIDNGDGNYSVSDSVTPGRYYIRPVSTDGHATGNGNYTLTVNFSG
jgi:hypothetical protein